MTTVTDAYKSVNVATFDAIRANCAAARFWTALDDSDPGPAPKGKPKSRDYFAEAMAELNELLGDDA